MGIKEFAYKVAPLLPAAAGAIGGYEFGQQHAQSSHELFRFGTLYPYAMALGLGTAAYYIGKGFVKAYRALAGDRERAESAEYEEQAKREEHEPAPRTRRSKSERRKPIAQPREKPGFFRRHADLVGTLIGFSGGLGLACGILNNGWFSSILGTRPNPDYYRHLGEQAAEYGISAGQFGAGYGLYTGLIVFGVCVFGGALLGHNIGYDIRYDAENPSSKDSDE